MREGGELVGDGEVGEGLGGEGAGRFLGGDGEEEALARGVAEEEGPGGVFGGFFGAVWEAVGVIAGWVCVAVVDSE